MTKEPVRMKVAIATNANALKVHGVDGFQATFDIPNSEREAFGKLIDLRNKVLNMSLEPE